MNKKIFTIVCILLITALSAAAFLIHLVRGIGSDMDAYFLLSREAERRVIQGMPIFEDFTSPEKERQLRSHLQEDHMKAAMEKGVSPVSDDAGLEELKKTGSLVSIDTGKEGLHFFYNVKKSRRYATPLTAGGLALLTKRFQENLNKRTGVPPVKLAISSVLRTSSYQQDLMKTNANAAVVTSHCYGTSFDIFYDEYFMVPPVPEKANFLSRKIMESIRLDMGFLLGASLRRQLHSILMETLIELQEEGFIYAILEKRQRCYHVTVLKDR